MTTQIVFNIDPKVKARAMKRAKSEGIPFSAILKVMTKGFADGRFSLDIEERVRPEKLRLWERQSRLVEQGKGRRFASAKEAMEFVENL